MNTNTVKKEEAKALTVKSAKVIEYVDKVDADRENRLVGEIKLITEQTKQVVLMGSIEIGRRLVEAKNLIKHGQWGAWLKDRIDYSQRTANNFMRIYKEYGENGLAEKSQSIANLSYTHALALLDVPAEERAKFAEETNAKDMKIKELQEAIKRLNAEKESAVKASEQHYQRIIEQTNLAIDTAKTEQKRLSERVKELEVQAQKAEKSKDDEVKKRLDAAVAEERKSLEKKNGEVNVLQAEIAALKKKHEEQMELARRQERSIAQQEIAKKDKEIAKARADMQAELKKTAQELEQADKKYKKEQDKNKLAKNLGTCAFAIEELLDVYAMVLDAISDVGRYDNAKADKLLGDLDKNLEAIRQRGQAKLKLAQAQIRN